MSRGRWRYRCWWQLFNLPYQEAFLVDELVVLGAIFEKRGEKPQELFAVADENALDSDGFVRIRHKNLVL